MKKPLAIIEISSTKIKLLVGCMVNETPIVVYHTSRDIPGVFVDGKLVNREKLVQALTSFKSIRDDSARMEININEVNLVLPVNGLVIYQSRKTTTTVNADGAKVSEIDIENVIHQVRNEKIPDNQEIIEVAPAAFYSDDGTKFANANALIGSVRARSISVEAFLHCLPKGTTAAFNSILQDAGFRVLRNSIQPYAEVSLFALDKSLPDSYFLVDIGANNSNVSLIGKYKPYAGTSFYLAGEELTSLIATEFGIPREKAEMLKKKYGYDERECSYTPALIRSNESTHGHDFYQKDLNLVIEHYFEEEYLPRLDATISSLESKYGNSLAAFPLVITGGASLLFGIEKFFIKHYPSKPIYLGHPHIVGGRDPSFVSLLGMAVNANSFKGNLSDHEEGYSKVRREEKVKDEKKKKRSSLEEDTL